MMATCKFILSYLIYIVAFVYIEFRSLLYFHHLSTFRFNNAGIVHYDLFFPDGSCPPRHILQKFLQISEESDGAMAVHCKVMIEFFCVKYSWLKPFGLSIILLSHKLISCTTK